MALPTSCENKEDKEKQTMSLRNGTKVKIKQSGRIGEVVDRETFTFLTGNRRKLPKNKLCISFDGGFSFFFEKDVEIVESVNH